MLIRLLAVLSVLGCASIGWADEVTSVQDDWSGGPGNPGPVTEWGAVFSDAEGVAWGSIPGQLALATTPTQDPIRAALPDTALGAIKIYAADVDLDGDTDVLGCTHYGDQLLLFVNDGGVPPVWERWVIDDAFAEALAVAVDDLDGDGLPDILGGSAAGAEVVWWRNLGGSPPQWERHSIDGEVPGAHDVAAADLDGDGDRDVIAVSFEDDMILWWRNDGGSPISWDRMVIDSGFDYPTKVAIADVDHDGDLDLFSVAWHSRQIAWWRNEGGEPIAWTEQVIAESFVGAHWVDAADVDGDGWVDVVGAAMNLAQVAWWRNDGAGQTSWEKTTVTSSLSGAVSAVAGDLDGDGDLDIGGAGWSTAGGMAWFENVDGLGTMWEREIVDSAFGPSSSVHIADVDGNGSLDLLGSAWDHNEFAWWRVGNFVEEGWLVSSILDAGRPAEWMACGWRASEPDATVLTVDARTSNNPEKMGEWLAIGPGAGCPGLPEDGRYLQYRVWVDSTDPTASPILDEISFSWQPKTAPAPRSAGGRVSP